MGSQVNIEGNEAKTKKMIQALVPFIVLTSQRGPYRYISSQALCISTCNLRNPVFHQQQLRHSKLSYIASNTKGLFGWIWLWRICRCHPRRCHGSFNYQLFCIAGLCSSRTRKIGNDASSLRYLAAWHWQLEMAMVVCFWMLVVCAWTCVLSTDDFLIHFSGFLYLTVTAFLWFQHALIDACPTPSYLHLANKYLLRHLLASWDSGNSSHSIM